MTYFYLVYPQLIRLQKEILKHIQNQKKYKYTVGEYEEGKTLYITNGHLIAVTSIEECIFNYNSKYLSEFALHPNKIRSIIDDFSNIDNNKLIEVKLSSIIKNKNNEYAVLRNQYYSREVILNYKYFQFFDIDKYKLKLYIKADDEKFPVIIKTPKEGIFVGAIFPILNTDELNKDIDIIQLLNWRKDNNE